MAALTDKNREASEKGSGAPPEPLSADFLSTAPQKPGVYLMKDRQGRILYVGKAKNLRKRLSSYQRATGADSPKTVLLLERLAAIDTILTHTEKEAFILESSLIKKHRPKFNIELKDDKSYPRIKVTVGEEWPRIYMTRRHLKDGSRYFGPYSSAGAMRSTLNLINRAFPLRRCKGRRFKKRARPCLNYQMGRCLAPCSGMVDKKQYRRMVDSALMVLEGKSRDLRDRLKIDMEKAATLLDFEKAAVLRDQLAALNKTLENQVVSSNQDRDQDVFGFVRRGAGTGIAVLNIRQGVVLGKLEFFLLDPIGDDGRVLREVLQQFYSRDDHTMPDEVLLPFEVTDQKYLAEWLSENHSRQVKVLVPKRGRKVQLLKMAETNAVQVHTDQENRERGWLETARNLQKKLNLERLPARIECLDVSNIGGRQPVGSLVCFLDGERAPKEYRHYSIASAHEPDDYRMMAEVLGRRFRTDDAGERVPDLFVVDGGKGHLNVAVKVLAARGLLDRVELAAIAKDRQGKTDKIYRPGRKNAVSLARHSPVLFFLMQIRDEAHRFGITFHRRLRQKHTLASELDKIPGIGPARKKILLKHLGSLAAVKKASRPELGTVEGIGPELAEQIWKFFHE